MQDVCDAPGIYMIRSRVTKGKYIGKSILIKTRISYHFSQLRRLKHGNINLQNHFNKYGPEDLIVTVLELCGENILCLREQYYINKKSPEFNIDRLAKTKPNNKRPMKKKNNKYPTKKKKHSSMNLESRKTKSEDFPPEMISDDTKEVLRKIRFKKRKKIAE